MFVKLSRLLSSIFLTFLLISFFAANSSGLSVSHSYNGGSGSISGSQNYNLDASTAMKSTTIFGGGSMQQTIQADGKGQNSLGQQIKGNQYSTKNTLSSSGSFSASSSSVASSTAASTDQGVSSSGESTLGQSVAGEGYSLQNSVTSSGLLSHSGSISAAADDGNMKQQLVGIGNVDLTTSGIKGEDKSGQKANVEAGLMVSDQSISAGRGVSGSLSAEIAGKTGQVASNAISDKNAMIVSGSFTGSGVLDAALSENTAGAGTGSKASAGGDISMDGVKWIDGSSVQGLQENTGQSLNCLREDAEGGLGTFESGIAKMDRSAFDQVNKQSQKSYQTNGGSASSYVLAGWRWNDPNPNIKLVVADDSYLHGEGLTGTQVQGQVTSATQTWNSVVANKPFAATGAVSVSSSAKADAADNSNTVAFRPISGGLAYTRVYYNYANPYNSATESDLVFNTNYQWSLNAPASGPIDVQSVALHELGHTIGLGDLYLSSVPEPKHSDYNQIMNAYNDPQRILGDGDIAGAQSLYGNVNVQNARIPIYRMWSQAKTDHFYTTSYNEYTTAVNSGYKQEGILGYIFSTSQPGTAPVYSMWSPALMDHFLTSSYSDYSTTAVKYGYQQEGILGYLYSSSQPSTTPLYRMWNPAKTDHFYTTSYNEYSKTAVNFGYRQEGILDYLPSP